MRVSVRARVRARVRATLGLALAHDGPEDLLQVSIAIGDDALDAVPG